MLDDFAQVVAAADDHVVAGHQPAVAEPGELLADAFELAALRPIDGPSPERDVYALLPPGGRHPLAKPMLEALTITARALNR